MSLFRRRFSQDDEPDPNATIREPLRRDALRRELARATGTSDDQIEVVRTASGVRPGAPSAAGVVRRVAFELTQIAAALDLRAIARDLGELARVSAGDDFEVVQPRLSRMIETCGVHAGRLVKSASVMKECVGGLIDALGGLEAQERETRDALVTLRDRLDRADDIEELETLRFTLIEHARALIDQASLRQAAIAGLTVSAQESRERALALEAALKEAESESKTDPLTGLPNRRALDETVTRRAAAGLPVGVLLLDLDRFKRINDEHGHAAGDLVLKTLGRLLDAELRGDDEAFRVGGEEVVVLLSDSDHQGARATAERLRARLARRAIPVGTSAGLLVTMSVGVAVWAPPQPFDEALKVADRALYRAKDAGRNRVIG
ncbi:MAG: diguanylate cyclase [Sandaracinaceae bacterium]